MIFYVYTFIHYAAALYSQLYHDSVVEVGNLARLMHRYAFTIFLSFYQAGKVMFS